MKEETRLFLLENSEEEYRKFLGSLLPGEKNMLGIRLPVLRKKAKELARGDWKGEWETEDRYFEEIMLRGMMISYVKGDMDEMLPYIADFIPRVNNWSVCDSVFAKMDVLRTDRERTWQFIQPYLYSDQEFEVRVGIIIMMQHLLKCDENGKNLKRLRTVSLTDCIKKEQEKPEPAGIKPEPAGIKPEPAGTKPEPAGTKPEPAGTKSEPEGTKPEPTNRGSDGVYLTRILEALDRPFSQYYASMAAAWTVAEAFCCYPADVYPFLKDNRLDDATHNRALQKIVESLIPQPEVKKEMKKMKRKCAVCRE